MLKASDLNCCFPQNHSNWNSLLNRNGLMHNGTFQLSNHHSAFVNNDLWMYVAKCWLKSLTIHRPNIKCHSYTFKKNVQNLVRAIITAPSIRLSAKCFTSSQHSFRIFAKRTLIRINKCRTVFKDKLNLIFTVFAQTLAKLPEFTKNRQCHQSQMYIC